MPVMGFDDERIRDAWVDEEVRRAVWLVVHGEPVEGTLAAAMEEAREVVRAFVEAVVEAFKPLLEAFAAIGEAVVEAFKPLLEAFAAIGEAGLEEIRRVWELIEGAGEEPAGRYRGPRHYNCRWADRSPLPVERVDPVRAGRARWWTRK